MLTCNMASIELLRKIDVLLASERVTAASQMSIDAETRVRDTKAKTEVYKELFEDLADRSWRFKKRTKKHSPFAVSELIMRAAYNRVRRDHSSAQAGIAKASTELENAVIEEGKALSEYDELTKRLKDANI